MAGGRRGERSAGSGTQPQQDEDGDEHHTVEDQQGGTHGVDAVGVPVGVRHRVGDRIGGPGG
ncbi:hypothetical protein C1I99_17475 [Micromonospora deserti]|uniref:Uncharacterized protein n=1 Tax=Micromonospora deserti TaxID=2070366 RepID=A0A2W2CS73_9ACTN|nr:hypothetical protein C1I99_17475 [Micromonospora deserti]